MNQNSTLNTPIINSHSLPSDTAFIVQRQAPYPPQSRKVQPLQLERDSSTALLQDFTHNLIELSKESQNAGEIVVQDNQDLNDDRRNLLHDAHTEDQMRRVPNQGQLNQFVQAMFAGYPTHHHINIVQEGARTIPLLRQSMTMAEDTLSSTDKAELKAQKEREKRQRRAKRLIEALDTAWGGHMAWIPESFRGADTAKLNVHMMSNLYTITKLYMAKEEPLQQLWQPSGLLYVVCHEAANPAKLTVAAAQIALARARGLVQPFENMNQPPQVSQDRGIILEQQRSVTGHSQLTSTSRLHDSPHPSPASPVASPVASPQSAFSLDLANENGISDAISGLSDLHSPEKGRHVSPVMSRWEHLDLHGISSPAQQLESCIRRQSPTFLQIVESDGQLSPSPPQPNSRTLDGSLQPTKALPDVTDPLPTLTSRDVSSSKRVLDKYKLDLSLIRKLQSPTAWLDDSDILHLSKLLADDAAKQAQLPPPIVMDPLWVELDRSGELPSKRPARFLAASNTPIIIPLHHRYPGHWSLLLASPGSSLCDLQHFDSCRKQSRTDELEQRLTTWLKDTIGLASIRFRAMDCPQQTDDSSCGPHVVWMIWHLVSQQRVPLELPPNGVRAWILRTSQSTMQKLQEPLQSSTDPKPSVASYDVHTTRSKRQTPSDEFEALKRRMVQIIHDAPPADGELDRKFEELSRALGEARNEFANLTKRARVIEEALSDERQRTQGLIDTFNMRVVEPAQRLRSTTTDDEGFAQVIDRTLCAATEAIRDHEQTSSTILDGMGCRLRQQCTEAENRIMEITTELQELEKKRALSTKKYDLETKVASLEFPGMG